MELSNNYVNSPEDNFISQVSVLINSSLICTESIPADYILTISRSRKLTLEVSFAKIST